MSPEKSHALQFAIALLLVFGYLALLFLFPWVAFVLSVGFCFSFLTSLIAAILLLVAGFILWLAGRTKAVAEELAWRAQTFDDWNKELDMPKNWKGPALPADWRVLRADETIQFGDRVGYDNRLTPSWRPTRRVGERARCRQDENSLLPRQVYIRGVEKPTFSPEDNDGCRGPHYTPAAPSMPAAPKVNYEARTFPGVPLSIPVGYYTLLPTEQVCHGDKIWSPSMREWTEAQNWRHANRRQSAKLLYIRRFPEVTTNL